MSSSPSSQKPQRKSYVRPALTKFGALADLTAGGSGAQVEMGDNAMNKRP